MIQNRLHDKEKEIQGLKKQTSSLLNRAWEKGYIAGFDDGYETGKQAEESKGEWLEDSGNIACSYCHTIWLYRRTDFCPHCGADMRKEAENDHP